MWTVCVWLRIRVHWVAFVDAVMNIGVKKR